MFVFIYIFIYLHMYTYININIDFLFTHKYISICLNYIIFTLVAGVISSHLQLLRAMTVLILPQKHVFCLFAGSSINQKPPQGLRIQPE